MRALDSLEQPLREAKDSADKALELDPRDGEAWALLGSIEIMQRPSEDCLEAFEKGVEFEPGNAEVQGLMAFAYLRCGDTERSRQHQQQMLRLCPVHPNWFYLVGANLEYNAGSLTDAIAILRQGIAVEPDSPLCRFYLIDYLMQLGDKEAAAGAAEEIRALDAEVRGRGIVHVESTDEKRRDLFRKNLESFDLY